LALPTRYEKDGLGPRRAVAQSVGQVRRVSGGRPRGADYWRSAIFLILGLSQPYTSLLRISPAGLEQVIVDLDK
jgi:hypothetical protein